SASASSSRPAASCSLASASNWRNSCSGVGGAGATTAGAGPGPVSAIVSINGVTQALDHRRQNVDRGLHVLHVMSVAVTRAVVKRLRHLRIAGGTRVTPVVMETDAGRVKRLADEVEHAADAAFLVVDDVLVADRQVTHRQFRAVVLNQLHNAPVMQC